MKVQINHHFQVPQIHHQRKCHPHKIQEAQFLHSYHCTLQIEFFQQYLDQVWISSSCGYFCDAKTLAPLQLRSE